MPCPWDFPHVDAERLLPARGPRGIVGRLRLRDPGQPDAEPLETFLEILPEHFAPWPLEDRYLTAHVVRVLPCNWKVALEAFIESYHTVAVHPQLLTTSGDTQTEYDVYPGVRHVNRMITPVGIASEHVDHDVAEQEIVDAMFLTRDDPDAAVPDGATARHVLAARTRRRLSRTDRPRLLGRHRLRGPRRHRVLRLSQLHALGRLHHAALLPLPSERHRPRERSHGRDAPRALPDRRGPAGPVPTRHLADGQSWADAPELGYLGRILNQDTATLARVQQGLQARSAPT
jgi:phenylpropionate dioxygenase-like ring-hydroxylating dioxygenase large terminal subunit